MIQLPPELVPVLEDGLSGYHGVAIRIIAFSSSSGGCINDTGLVETDRGAFFLKWNDRTRFPDMLATEANGLTLLRNTGVLDVPEVIGVYEAGNLQCIAMTAIEPGQKSNDYWKELGRGLANLHKVTSPFFGLAYDNYIGSLPQCNTQSSSWKEFLIHHRFEKQLALAERSRFVDAGLRNDFEILYRRLDEMLNEERPSLLHGDLWSGNIMTNHKGLPALIDPAVYFGHREVDLAMSRLFGGFDRTFYDAYSDIFPLEPGWKERCEIYTLYPLLVHVNLFGGAYLSQVRSVLKKLV
jgi:protein-ribulosamine 3-kinase